MSTQTPLLFCTACKPSISGLKKVNWNAFRLNFFALFEIFWVYLSGNLICSVGLNMEFLLKGLNPGSLIFCLFYCSSR